MELRWRIPNITSSMSDEADDSGRSSRNSTSGPANYAGHLTGAGIGAVAVIRIRGPLTQSFLAAHFSRGCAVGRSALGTFRDRSGAFDDGLVMLADQWTADLNLHGSPRAVERMLEAARSFGFKLVDGREASLLCDGRSMLEREIAASLPHARTLLGIRLLLAQELAWKQTIWTADSTSARQVAQRVLSDRSMERLLDPPRVAIIGRPNTGKSTLANRLFGEERSIAADEPGTTRDWVGDFCDMAGLPVLLLDTPGVRAAADDLESSAISLAAPEAARADLRILVLDGSVPIWPIEEEWISGDRELIVVANKADLPAAWDCESRGALPVSAIDGAGINALAQRITAYFRCHELNMRDARCWTERQRRILVTVVHEGKGLEKILVDEDAEPSAV